MWDRAVLINLDKRRERLGAFKAKILPYPSLHNYVRCRAIPGDLVGVPQTFVSGGGAFGCRQSHLRVLEEAMMDGVGTLLILEDDVTFAENFEEKLAKFLKLAPDDWDGLMLGGQDMHAGSLEIGIPGVRKCQNTQRTHAYVVRGHKPMQDLYRLWAKTDRHIDHVFGIWQRKWIVYRPDPFLCYQDKGPSDISGRNEKLRSWNGVDASELPKDVPIRALICDRVVAEHARNYGLHFGYDRDPITGLDKGMTKISMENWPAAKLTAWANTIVAEAIEAGDTPALWHSQLPDGAFLEARMGRKVVMVEGRTIIDLVNQIPELRPHHQAAQIIWCIRSDDIELLEGMKHFGWHRGNWTDEVTGLDQGLRTMAHSGNWSNVRNLVRQLRREILTVRHGKILLAHPQLNLEEVRKLFPEDRVVEIIGKDLPTVLEQHAAEVSNEK